MYYVYILQMCDGKLYSGYTNNLEQRFEQYKKGQVPSTKHKRPLQLVYFEGCIDQEDATRREKYFKTHYGKMFLKRRLKSYFTGQR